ncbi:MAG: hypothetical protein V7K40_24205 [Nostoc sp.]
MTLVAPADSKSSTQRETPRANERHERREPPQRTGSPMPNLKVTEKVFL